MKSRMNQLFDLALNGSEQDLRKLNRVLSHPIKGKLFMRWVLDDTKFNGDGRAWDQKRPVRKGTGSY